MTGRSVALVVKSPVDGAGLDPNQFSGDSLRAGLITSSAAVGLPEGAIQRQTRQRSVTQLRKYVRHGSLFTGNVTREGGGAMIRKAILALCTIGFLGTPLTANSQNTAHDVSTGNGLLATCYDYRNHYNVRFLETSAKDSKNVDRAFVLMTREIKNRVTVSQPKKTTEGP